MAFPASYRLLLLPIYVPSFMLAASRQALLILLPLYVLELGGSPAFAGLVVGLRGLGMLSFDVPAGVLVSRFGDKPVMLGGLICMAISAVVFASVTDPQWLVPVAILSGIGFASWLLGRLSYVTEACPLQERGRAIAVLAGFNRVGAFLGPAVGGVVAAVYGYPAAFLGVAIAAAIAALLVTAFTGHGHTGHDRTTPHFTQLGDIVREHWYVFLTAGFWSIGLQSMRAARQLLVPLYGDAVGLDVAVIGTIYSFSSALDMALVYPVGVIVDRWGRKWTAVPSMILFVLGLVLLPLATEVYTLTGVSLLLGLASGIGMGIVMMLGADLAPTFRRGQFLGVWRLVGDCGNSGGPLVIGLLAEVASLGAATLMVAGVGSLGLLVLLLFVEETLKKPDTAEESGLDPSEQS